jgi:undecaprenyl-diphosphatase
MAKDNKKFTVYATWGLGLFIIIIALLQALHKTSPAEKSFQQEQGQAVETRCSAAEADAPRAKKNLYQKLIKLNYSAFKYINSGLKCKFLDFYISVISYCDSKKFNLSFISILIISLGILWNYKKEHFLTMIILLACILVVGTVITHSLKYCFKTSRPLTVLGNENVNVLFEMLRKNSFPSGHTQAAFSICTFMFIMIRKYWYWYTVLAFGVAFERIYAGSHFPIDVLVGAAIGIFSTCAIVTSLEKLKRTLHAAK